MDTVLAPLYWVVSWIMIGWHEFFSLFMDADSGGTWALSIIGLVVVMRIILIPLFVKQIKSMRNMQLIQPQMRELQAKYGHDKEKLSQEMMKLYKDTGSNPFSSCLPVLAQAPFFFALFRVLNGIAEDVPRGAFADYPALFASLSESTVFGAPLAASFATAYDYPNPTTTRVIAGVMVVLMTTTTFFTQRQLMRQNMPKSALEGPFAQQQKILLYILPLMFLFSGYYFPLGVVLYWLTSNIWTMGQQFYVIRRMPAPGTPAEEAMRKRKEAKAIRKGKALPPAETGPSVVVAEPSPVDASPKRQQPKKQSRSQRKSSKK
ncbi:MAG: membrane protein insertase YidC [Jiangellales bacterium]